MRMPRVNSSAAKMAVADELIYRIVNRCAQSADLPPIASITEGARSNALSCVSSVTSTLLLSVTKDLPLDKNDVLFHCLKGARGAWVLLRAAQVWDRQIGRAYGQVAHSDGATEEGRFAILPPSEEERIKELAHLCATTAHRPSPTAHRPPPIAHRPPPVCVCSETGTSRNSRSRSTRLRRYPSPRCNIRSRLTRGRMTLLRPST